MWAARQYVTGVITLTIRMPAHPMAITVQIGFWAVSLSVPGPGIQAGTDAPGAGDGDIPGVVGDGVLTHTTATAGATQPALATAIAMAERGVRPSLA